MDVRYEPWKAWAIAVGLFIFMLLNFADKVVIGLTAVPMMHDFHISPVEFGVIAGVFYYLFVATGLVGGFLANKFQTRWLLAIMALGWSIAQLPIAIGNTVFFVIVSRVILGFFEGPAWGIAVHSCFKWFPKNKRVLPLTLLNMGVYVSFIVAGATMPLVTMHWGWRSNFILLGVVTLVWGMAWVIFSREGKMSVIEDEGDDPSGKTTPMRLSYFKLLLNRTMMSVIFMQFLAYAAVVLVFSWVPAYIEKGLDISAVTAGHLFSLLVAISVPLSFVVSWFCQRLSRNGVSSRIARGVYVSGCVLISGIAFVLLWLLGASLPVSGVIFILAIAWTFSIVMFNITPSIVDEIAPVSQRAAVLTIYQAIATTSGIVAPIVMGELVQSGLRIHEVALGYERGFAVLGIMLALSAVLGFVYINPGRDARRIRMNHECLNAG